MPGGRRAASSTGCPRPALAEPPTLGDAARPPSGEGVRTAASTQEVTMTIGPVQVLVIGFADPNFDGQSLKELARLRESDIVRVIDLVVVYKHDDGTVEQLQKSDLSDDEKQEFGAIAGA